MADEGDRRWSLDALVSMLAPSVGNERARAATLSALAALGAREATLDEEDARRVFAYLQGVGGLTGIAARRALTTLTASDPVDRSVTTPMAPLDKPRGLGLSDEAVTNEQRPKVSALTRRDIADLLEHAVGRAEAEAAVERASKSVGFQGSGSLAEAMKVLEAIAAEPGLVGVAARFAKARLAPRAK
jgi:hypothetical protein